MASNGEEPLSQGTKEHRADAYATKLAGKVDKVADKKAEKLGSEKKGPAGGFDPTPVPKASPGYTIKITFHKATNLPFADLNSLSSDPYILAQLNTRLPLRHKQDPRLRFRTTTKRRNVNPEWNEDWIIANVPAEGFELKCRVYDEDPADHDDRLGNIHVPVAEISENWAGIAEQPFKIKKRMGSKRAYFFRGCAAILSKEKHMSGQVFVSIQLLGRTENGNGGRLYTVGPCAWSQHFSPLMGRVAGTKDPEKTENGRTTAEQYNFQANQIQLSGPVPEELYHRYVEFRPFVAGMFTGKSIRGWLLNRALHHQHARVYNYDGTTIYGSFGSPCKDLTMRFLDLVHYDRGGRIFTYVLTLDGQWRFTETGKQFGIDLLSKHTMHSDVSIYIAFSGEFFVRRLKTPWREPSEQEEHPPDEISGGPPDSEPLKDPEYYHLIIDNDSGTYRPNKDLLPLLKEFMQRNLPGLKVSTLDCQGDADKMEKMKNEQRERRKTEGDDRVYAQMNDSSSFSSSDEEDLNTRAGEPPPPGKLHQRLQKPADKFEQLRQLEGDRLQREQRETEEDTAATGLDSQGSKASEDQQPQRASSGVGEKQELGEAIS